MLKSRSDSALKVEEITTSKFAIKEKVKQTYITNPIAVSKIRI